MLQDWENKKADGRRTKDLLRERQIRNLYYIFPSQVGQSLWKLDDCMTLFIFFYSLVFQMYCWWSSALQFSKSLFLNVWHTGRNVLLYRKLRSSSSVNKKRSLHIPFLYIRVEAAHLQCHDLVLAYCQLGVVEANKARLTLRFSLEGAVAR